MGSRTELPRRAARRSSGPLLGLLAAGGAIGALALLLRPRAASAAPVALPRPGEPVVWVGGNTRENRDALRFLLASENPSRSQVVWALQALAANNWTRRLQRKQPRIGSIADMLQAGVKGKEWQYGLGWGKQYDPATGIRRWASTSAGLKPDKVPGAITRFVEQLLDGTLDYEALRGKKGETMPPSSDWPAVSGFLQYDDFQKTVLAQTGGKQKTTAEEMEKRWGNPRLVAEVDGVRFYA